MSIVTATEITIFTDISASAGTITASGLIPIVQERINHITNNWFTTDMYMGGTVTFNATNGTLVSGSDWSVEGFVAGDEIHVYGSYRNDGYKTVGSVSTVTLTVATGSTVYNEPSGRSILVSVVQWPNALRYVAAQMVKYDFDDRTARPIGVVSHTLGPFSESYGSTNQMGGTPFGYPQELIDSLSSWTIARVN
jgi:hypothetical protein